MASSLFDIALHDAPTTCIISSRMMGDFEVPTSAIIRFPTPLGGFPDEREFVLVPARRAGLWWMQSVDEAHLIFLLGDPFVLDADYGFDLSNTDRQVLQIETEIDAFGLVMLTLPGEPGGPTTANFRAPLVFNLERGLGMQVLSREDKHELRRHVNVGTYPPQPDGFPVQQ